MRDVGQGNGGRDGDTTLVLLLENDIWWLLVYPNSKTLQLILDNLLVRQRLVHVEYDEDEMTSLCNCNNLPTTTLAILGSLNDTGQVQNLDLRTVIDDLSRNGCQGREFIGGSYTSSSVSFPLHKENERKVTNLRNAGRSIYSSEYFCRQMGNR